MGAEVLLASLIWVLLSVSIMGTPSKQVASPLSLPPFNNACIINARLDALNQIMHNIIH